MPKYRKGYWLMIARALLNVPSMPFFFFKDYVASSAFFTPIQS